MTKRLLAAALAASAAACTTTADAPPDPALLAQNYAMLEEALCPAASGETPFPPLYSQAADPSIPPMQVFDNLFFLGTKVDTAWALETSEGIILFDAMFPYEIEPVVVEGLRALGRDPADIKYVVVSHGHADHFGGAKFLQDTYGVQIVASNTDWETILATTGDTPIPRKDIGVEDGDTLTLGDTTIRFVRTPGHTPGTISSLIPVRGRDHDHLAALWGGTAMNFLSPEGIEIYQASIKRFRAIDPDVDVILSNHAYADAAELKMAALASGVDNPFVVGNEAIQDWFDVIDGCAEQWIAQKRAVAQSATP